MPRPIPTETRKFIVKYVKSKNGENGEKGKNGAYKEASILFGVGIASVSRFMRLDREKKGDVSPKAMGGYRGERCVNNYSEEIFAILKKDSDATLNEIAVELEGEVEDLFCESTIHNFMDRNNITRKRKTVFAKEQDREDVKEASDEWFDQKLNAADCFFIDEVGAKTNLTRTHTKQKGREGCIKNTARSLYELHVYWCFNN